MPDNTITDKLPAPPPSPPPTPTNAPAVVATQSPTPDGGSAESVTVKSGMSTTEFWLTFMITTVGLLAGSGILTSNTAIQIAGFAAAVLKSGLYLWSRTQIKTANAITMIAVVLFAFHSSACTAAAGDKALRATLTTTQAAEAAFGPLDLAYQERLRTSSTTQEEAQAKVNNYRAGEQITILKAFAATYAAISAAALYRDDPHLTTLLTVAAQLAAELGKIQMPGGAQ